MPKQQFAVSPDTAAHPDATITVSARRDGTTIEAAGSLPVASGRWDTSLFLIIGCG